VQRKADLREGLNGEGSRYALEGGLQTKKASGEGRCGSAFRKGRIDPVPGAAANSGTRSRKKVGERVPLNRRTEATIHKRGERKDVRLLDKGGVLSATPPQMGKGLSQVRKRDAACPRQKSVRRNCPSEGGKSCQKKTETLDQTASQTGTERKNSARAGCLSGQQN